MSSRKRKTYTDQQVEAFIRAVIVDGHSVAEAMRRALAGTLAEGLAPFGYVPKDGRLKFGYDLMKANKLPEIRRDDDVLDAASVRAIREAQEATYRELAALSKNASSAERARLSEDLAKTMRARKAAEGRQAKASKPTPKLATEKADTSVLAELLEHNNTPHARTPRVNTPQTDETPSTKPN